VVFTREVIATRGALSDAAVAAFRAAGFNEANALEVVLGVSLATLCNFANNLAQNELNQQLAPYRWEADARVA
jgi:alkylhydroperoxidase family enzyme